MMEPFRGQDASDILGDYSPEEFGRLNKRIAELEGEVEDEKQNVKLLNVSNRALHRIIDIRAASNAKLDGENRRYRRLATDI